MITIKEVRRSLKEDNYYIVVSFIDQQEKVDELLGLYRNHHYHLLQGNVAPMLRIRDKIFNLESELNDNKWRSVRISKNIIL